LNGSQDRSQNDGPTGQQWSFCAITQRKMVICEQKYRMRYYSLI